MGKIRSKKRNFTNRCCNPFREEKHNTSSLGLRNVSKWMCLLDEFEIKNWMKVCDKCRKKLYKNSKNKKRSSISFHNVNSPKSLEETRSSHTFSVDPETALESLNKTLVFIGESPIKKRKRKRKSYVTSKIEGLADTISGTGISKPTEKGELNKEKQMARDYNEIMCQLKVKFSSAQTRSEKLLILSILPNSWSVQKICSEFDVGISMARAVKELVKQKGVLSTPNPKPGKSLKPEIAELVKEFYQGDDASRLMPGLKDTVSVGKGKMRENVQKRLILMNLKEMYKYFKKKHPEVIIGFSKFSELRPKHCILAGQSGTHSFCVCIIHHNIKLMMSSGETKQIITSGDSKKNFKDIMKEIMCDPPTENCHMNECVKCPGTELLKKRLLDEFEKKYIERVTYRQWLSTDRCNLETIVKEVDDFVESFCDGIVKLKTHDFIATKQKEYFDQLKANLKDTEALVTGDFAENYSVVRQDEVQSGHWAKNQITIHPFVVYFKSEGPIKHMNFAFLSDCLNHDTIAVYTFQSRLIEYLKNINPNFKKIFYFSDGSAAQYKNRKNFIDLCYHKTDFKLDAEWHFYATCHGKSACDGIGGTIKRLAAKASLQRPYEDQILTAEDLFEFGNLNIHGINFLLTTVEDYEKTERKLSDRFASTKTIEETQKFHAAIPLTRKKLKMKKYSLCKKHSTHDVAL